MSSLDHATVSLNKANTKALRSMVQPGETVNALANRLLAEKLEELAGYEARRRELFPDLQIGDNFFQGHISHFCFTIITENILKELGVVTVRDLVRLKEEDIRTTRYFIQRGSGKRIKEIKDALASIGLHLAE